MRIALIIPALLLAGCDNAKEWENEQAELANELNATSPADTEDGTDYLNATSPANDLNATEPAANDVNAASTAENEAAPPPEG